MSFTSIFMRLRFDVPIFVYSAEKWHDVQRPMQGIYRLSSCERVWHANIHSFGLVSETLRAWWLAGYACKCGYWGPQILTECQIVRNYWCTQPVTAPDTSQTESLNVTDEWIFMILRKREEEQGEKNEHRVRGRKKGEDYFQNTDMKVCGITFLKFNRNSLQRR